MAQASGALVTTGTGATTDWVATTHGMYMLRIRWAGSPGSLRIQERELNSSSLDDFADVEAPDGGDLDITTDYTLVVPGNTEYRLNVTTHTSAATMTVRQFEAGY